MQEPEGAGQTAHEFHGENYFIRVNGQTYEALYRTTQLNQSIYPDLKRVFEKLGFDTKVPWNELLQVVVCGGVISLKGGKFINRQTYSMDRMRHVFMKREKKLVHAIMNIVFNKEANVPYMRKVSPFEPVRTSLEFNSSEAYRKTTTLFRALGDDSGDEELYLVDIEGTGMGESLFTHLFEFRPSFRWLSRRYPPIHGC